MTALNPSSGNDLDLSDAWDAAYNATDEVLIAMEGLIFAAGFVVDAHPDLNNPKPESAALTVVLDALREKSEAIREARSTEFRAGLALRKHLDERTARG